MKESHVLYHIVRDEITRTTDSEELDELVDVLLDLVLEARKQIRIDSHHED